MSSEHKREWWQRNLDRSFRILEGKHGRIRDPYELQQEIANGAAELRKETDAFTEKFQQDVESYTERLKNSISESSPLWTPLPTWMSWKKKKKRRIERLEEDRKIIDGRIVRGGWVPGGGRVHMTMEEKLAKIKEKRSMYGRETQISNRQARLSGKIQKLESEGWVPKVAGRLGTTRPANREAFLGGWEIVEKRLGRVKLGGTRVIT